MGILRFLLALCVALTHASLPALPGDLCVTIFFMISGYYMAMVIKENIAYHSIYFFYKQRLLRLLPTYWFILALTIIFSINNSTIFHDINNSLLTDKIELFLAFSFTQLFIIGQDFLYFLTICDGCNHINIIENLISNSYSLGNFNIVPTAWSLSLEIMFYLLVPFICRRSYWTLILAVFVSCLIRLGFAYAFGYMEDPWGTRFFFSELTFFILGMLAYFLVTKSDRRVEKSIYLILCAFAFWSLTVNIFRFGNVNIYISLSFLLALSIPKLFELTRYNRLDRKIGELSYPLYLCHILVFEIWALLNWNSKISSYLMVFISVIFAYFILKIIDQPVERYRQRLFKNRQRTAA